MSDLSPPTTFTHMYVRPGGVAWPGTSAGTHTVFFVRAGSAPPSAFDQAKLAAALERSCGAFLAIGEPFWRWTMRAIRTVVNEADLPALALIIERSADVDLLWLEEISKHSRYLGMTEAAPLPSLPCLLN